MSQVAAARALALRRLRRKCALGAQRPTMSWIRAILFGIVPADCAQEVFTYSARKPLHAELA
eukprot:1378871-Rhodomonas_salina.1